MQRKIRKQKHMKTKKALIGCQIAARVNCDAIMLTGP